MLERAARRLQTTGELDSTFRKDTSEIFSTGLVFSDVEAGCRFPRSKVVFQSVLVTNVA